METIETLNQRLKDHFGIDTASNKPLFQIVWAPDQIEKRLMETLDSGIVLLTPVVREVKKYSYIKDAHVLERLVIVPDFQVKELAGAQMSYEPLWVYKDKYENPLSPKWEPTKLIIDTLYAVMGRKSLRKYIDPDTVEGAKEARIAEIHQELFGNETDTGDALRYKEGVTVPTNYIKEGKSE